VDEFDKKAVTPLDEWISFLKTGEIPDSAQASGLPEARERLRIDRMEPKERRAYDAHMEALRYQRSVIQTGWIEGEMEGKAKGQKEGRMEGRIEGRAEGLAEGLRKGEREKALTIARNALKKGMSPEDVMELTGLKKEDLDSM
jgi:predicted transposase YdaD